MEAFVNPPEQSPAGLAAEGLLSALNEEQQRAVVHPGGPVLVLAGAGSGKTRVITYRIANLILHGGVQPSRIVAVTFTNKAAAEMRQRVQELLGSHGFGSWIGTFHALCLRILRRDGHLVGLEPGFNVYDGADQLVVVKRILKSEAGDSVTGTPRSFLSKISRCKNAMESPEDVDNKAYSPEAKLVASVYRQYQETLRRSNAADFDDLLLRTLDLFNDHDAVADGYASRCEQLLVDEYQDTNRPQYLLIRHLSSQHGNVCVVGDEDQSIYRFRGAEIRNILEFEADFKKTRTIRLEQNYRSSATIIEAASALITNNVFRKGKSLWTSIPRGELLELFQAPDDRTEATWVARRVRELEGEHALERIAVLYRTNAQSRLFEEIFRREEIPFQIVGSVQFYERKEIKDLLAYLKLAANPADDVSFRRIVNTPARGIGGTTLRLVEDVARGMGLPLMEAAGHALDQNLFGSRQEKSLRAFLDFAAELSRRSDDLPVTELLEQLIDDIDYEAYLEKAYSGMVPERMENVHSLISAAAEHAEEVDEATLQSFLDQSALVSDADEVGARPGVTLMTIHCSKGLEFPVVFLVGLEENLFPHAMASGTDEDLEEERRLCYVAMTRAQKRLLMSHAMCRRFQGALLPNPPSRFIDEIPGEAVRETTAEKEGIYWRRQESRDSGGSSAARAARPRKAPKPLRLQEDPGDGYAVGAFVKHPKFGGGQILDREGAGKHLKLTIHFSDHGTKKILPAYTKLLVESGEGNR
jgi:DNA helicase-2/ATP-dependent DNA helicase PcrA